MDHLPRFHRRKRDVAPPALITSNLSGKTTPPPGDLQPMSPFRPLQKLSPFKVFHRSSGKRARDSRPDSAPLPPAVASVPARDSSEGRAGSPASMSMQTDAAAGEGQKPARPPKMPAFLNQTEREIESKFSELVWRERTRLMQAVTNPSPDFRWARVSGPHLRVLDRYMNIQPWHNNRIKLQVPEGHVDYINASPIVLTPSPVPAADGRSCATREPDRYIAMQGPKKASVDHVWRMVVEQLESPGVIVMLTETHEGHIEKCFPYFPRSEEDPPMEINEHDEFGDGFRASVRCEGLEETPAGDAIELRKLVIRVHSRPKPGTTVRATNGRAATPEPTAADERDADMDAKMRSPAPSTTVPPSGTEDRTTSPAEDTSESRVAPATEPEERIVWHFLYKKWPDFGVPLMADLESFFTLMRMSREKNAHPNNPRIVHCSAGVGRSGTFIALEHLMRELDAGVLENYDERSATASARTSRSSRPPSSSQAADVPPSTPAFPQPWAVLHGLGEEAAAPGSEGTAAPISPDSPAMQQDDHQAKVGYRPGEDLIFETVDQLRQQRKTMVQAESQYRFLYQVLRKLWLERYGGGSDAGAGGDGQSNGDDDDDGALGEPAAKRLEVDPFVE